MRKLVGRILKIGTLLTTWGLICTVLIQIICRFTPIPTPSWTEEASRICFIYAISFAAGLAMKNDFFVHLDMFYEHMPARLQKLLTKVIPVITFLLFAVMGIYSMEFIILGLTEKSPSMGLNMGVAFFSMFVMSVSIGYYLGLRIIRNFKKPGR